MEKTNELLERLRLKTEEHLQASVITFQNLSEEQLLRPSATGGWSIAHCLDHLNSYGHFYLPHIRSAIEKSPESSPEGVAKSTWLGSVFIKMMDPASGKKYKAIKRHHPTNINDAYQVVAAFIEQLEKLLACLEAAKDSDLHAVKVPVSISRMIHLRLGDALQFLVTHTERHVLQAMKNVDL